MPPATYLHTELQVSDGQVFASGLGGQFGSSVTEEAAKVVRAFFENIAMAWTTHSLSRIFDTQAELVLGRIPHTHKMSMTLKLSAHFQADSDDVGTRRSWHLLLRPTAKNIACPTLGRPVGLCS
jgi:hypothetical protein